MRGSDGRGHGRATTSFSSLDAALPLIQDGRIRTVAATSKERMPQLPNVASLSEAPGMAECELINRCGVFAPGATPAPVLDRLADAALGNAGVRARPMEQGIIPGRPTRAAYRVLVREEARKFAAIIRDARISAEG